MRRCFENKGSESDLSKCVVLERGIIVIGLAINMRGNFGVGSGVDKMVTFVKSCLFQIRRNGAGMDLCRCSCFLCSRQFNSKPYRT